MTNVTRFSISVLLAILALGFAMKVTMAKDPDPVAAQERIRAKVGIEVGFGERRSLAKTTETLKARDSLRVYVIPENDAYIYVVHNDGKTLTLLNAQEAHTKVPQGSLVTLPAPEKFYQIDGASAKESITVICSPIEIREVATLFHTTNVPQHNWTALEEELLAKSKIDLNQEVDKPFLISGNVRSMANKPFIDNIPIFSGKTMVVRKYNFQIQQ